MHDKKRIIEEKMKNPFTYNPNVRVPALIAGNEGSKQSTSDIDKVLKRNKMSLIQ